MEFDVTFDVRYALWWLVLLVMMAIGSWWAIQVARRRLRVPPAASHREPPTDIRRGDVWSVTNPDAAPVEDTDGVDRLTDEERGRLRVVRDRVDGGRGFRGRRFE